MNTEIGQKVLEFYSSLPFNYYDSVNLQIDSVINQRPIEELYPCLKGLVTPSGKLLEIGAGAGWLTNAIAYQYKKKIIGG